MKHKLILLLSDGQVHAETKLSQLLFVPANIIKELIVQLRIMGIEVCSSGETYQIPGGLELLNVAQIQNRLSPAVLKQINLEILAEIDSTNQFLLDNRYAKPSGSLVFAEYQQCGRGRQQRRWFSPYGSNLYFSLLWTFDKSSNELAGLSLATGICVAQALKRYDVPKVQLKWPNDILCQHQKIAGVLIEMKTLSSGSTQVIIGIGINLRMPNNTDIEQPWIDVATAMGHTPDRHTIATYVIEELLPMLKLFQEHGLAPFFKSWQALDAYYHQPVTLMTAQESFYGIGLGINARGELILMTEDQTKRYFSQGEVSLRPRLRGRF